MSSTNSITLPPIHVLGAAAADIAEEARTALDLPTMRATDKAMLQLIEGTAPVPTIGGFLLESRTRPGIVHRLSATFGCSCEAGLNDRVCWHRQLMQIIRRAAEQFTMPALDKAETDDRRAEAERLMNELYS
jgi:hypothetical protein